MLLSSTTASVAAGRTKCEPSQTATPTAALGLLELVALGTAELLEVNELALVVVEVAELLVLLVVLLVAEVVEEVSVLTELMENEMRVPRVTAALVLDEEDVEPEADDAEEMREVMGETVLASDTELCAWTGSKFAMHMMTMATRARVCVEGFRTMIADCRFAGWTMRNM
ncbi:hypothetical protein PHSY_002478 [Pseudozyma hubeiensis SY62]|uniref:Uncharacterized protein n=1 Tax=Pseudozyma hubeiensis (strain SY62) TaxID=1305764 RepID=R9PA12_PSEHS|nr:hypothetical protein PHSY_002478 [Pseudozyma hubeiensis SY62]GAC94905.1 hypothetical protein PHSY_002478 [Pseudozyma hubeiensis SY62]